MILLEYKNILRISDSTGYNESVFPQSAKNYFWGLLGDYKQGYFYKYPNSIFFTRNDQGLMEYDIKIEKLFVSYGFIWLKIRSKFGYNHMEVSDLIKSEVEEHLKLRVNTTKPWFCQCHIQVEEHLKLRVNTTQRSET